MFSIKCMIGLHDYRVKHPTNPYPTKTPPSTACYMDGTVRFNAGGYSGIFIFYGYHSFCERCGHRNCNADDLDVPIISPRLEDLWQMQAGR